MMGGAWRHAFWGFSKARDTKESESCCPYRQGRVMTVEFSHVTCGPFARARSSDPFSGAFTLTSANPYRFCYCSCHFGRKKKSVQVWQSSRLRGISKAHISPRLLIHIHSFNEHVFDTVIRIPAAQELTVAQGADGKLWDRRESWVLWEHRGGPLLTCGWWVGLAGGSFCEEWLLS